MLILTRSENDTIVIGENVKVTILGVVGGQVKIGIEAPRNVAVNRSEIHARIQREASQRSTVDPESR